MTADAFPVLLAGYFAAVLGGAAAAGYALVLRRQAPPEAASGQPAGLRAWLVGVLKRVGEPVSRKETRAEITRQRLQAAGYRGTALLHLLYGIKCACGVLLGMACAAIALAVQPASGAALLAACAGLGAGYLAPDLVLDAKARARRSRLRAGLPAALELWALAIEAGQSLDQAVADSARELRRIYPDLSAELATLGMERRAGRPRIEALLDLGLRTREREMKKLARLLIDGERFGASLAPAVHAHARYLRLRAQQKAREAAEKVSVKLVFTIFLLIFPAVLLVTIGPAVLEIFRILGPLLE